MQCGCYYSQIDNCEYDWGRYVESAKLLKSVTKADVLALLDSAFLDTSAVKRIDSLIHGSSHPLPADGTPAQRGVTRVLTPQDLDTFRNGLTMVDTSLDPQAALQGLLDRSTVKQ